MPPEQTCERGDVLLVLFSHSDLRTAKTRPALVVQANDLETGMSQVIVAIINSQLFRAGHPSRVVIRAATPTGRAPGILGDSVVMTDNMATVALVAIDRVIGTVPMPAIDAALRTTLNL